MPYKTPVTLHGILGEKFGREWHLALDSGTPIEALTAIMRQRPGMRAWLLNAQKDGIGLRVLVGDKDVVRCDAKTRKALGDGTAPTDPVQNEEYHNAIERISGDLSMPSGRDPISFVAEPVAAGWEIWIGLIIIALMATSIYLQATQGVEEMDMKNADPADEEGSFAFSGPVNKRAQGAPLPVMMGYGLIGSHIGAFGIESVNRGEGQVEVI
jgi:predicted phage tail protein